MAFTFGFYNSIDGDRKYDADQFGDMFSGVINDGVFSNIGQALAVTPGGGLSVIVGTGRAWFNKTWSYNSTPMSLNLELSDLLLPRYDMIILEINKNSFARENSIKVITGTPSANPEHPVHTFSNNVYQYPLAYIHVAQNQEEITPGDIEIVVGRGDTPFVTAALESVDITVMYQQWEYQFDQWFKEVQTQLSDDVAGNLLYRMQNLEQEMQKPQQITTQHFNIAVDNENPRGWKDLITINHNDCKFIMIIIRMTQNDYLDTIISITPGSYLSDIPMVGMYSASIDFTTETLKINRSGIYGVLQIFN